MAVLDMRSAVVGDLRLRLVGVGEGGYFLRIPRRALTRSEPPWRGRKARTEPQRAALPSNWASHSASMTSVSEDRDSL